MCVCVLMYKAYDVSVSVTRAATTFMRALCQKKASQIFKKILAIKFNFYYIKSLPLPFLSLSLPSLIKNICKNI